MSNSQLLYFYIYLVVLLVSSARCNPTLRYRFCDPMARTVCLPETYGSNSTFRETNETSSHVELDDLTSYQRMSVICTDDQPLKWVITTPTVYAPTIKHEQSLVRERTGNVTEYYYQISLTSLTISFATVRCERYSDPNRAAEIVITSNREKPAFAMNRAKYLYFLAVKDEEGNIKIPCPMSGRQKGYDWNRELYRTAKSNRIIRSLTENCMDCLCRDGICGSTAYCQSETSERERPYYYSYSSVYNIPRCGPYSITKQQWIAAGRPALVGHNESDPNNGQSLINSCRGMSHRSLCAAILNSETQAWRECATDENCSKLVVTQVKKDIVKDCTRDGLVTCLDIHLAFKVYPSYSCPTASYDDVEFKAIEGCLNERDLEMVNGSEIVISDRRIGYVIRGDAFRYDDIYVCAADRSETDADAPNVYMTLMPLSPENKINVTLHFYDNPQTSSSNAIICEVLGEDRITAQLINVPCSTLPECEMLYNYQLGFKYLRNNTEGTVQSTKLLQEALGSHYYNDAAPYGTIIGYNNAYYGYVRLKTGIIGCFGYTYKDGYYVEHHDYHFVGLDSTQYLVAQGFPLHAIIKVTGNGTTPSCTDPSDFATVTCKISKFMLFPTLKFTLRYVNGSLKTVTMRTRPSQSDDWNLSAIKEDEVTAEQTLTLLDVDQIHSISCSAPWVNSTDWVTQTLAVKIHFYDLRRSGGGGGRMYEVTTYVALLVVVALAFVLVYIKRKEVYSWLNLHRSRTSGQLRGDMLLTVPSTCDIAGVQHRNQ